MIRGEWRENSVLTEMIARTCVVVAYIGRHEAWIDAYL